MWSKVRGFFSRHRNKFFVGGVLISGSILLTRYAQQRLKEWQEKETMEFLERNRKQMHFESIGRTCNQTTLNLSAALYEALVKVINTDGIIESLKSNPENKLELWNNLKVLVITKAGCLIYLIVMLVITLRVQLSIIGGYLYKDPNCVTTEMQEKYLTLCQNLLNGGVKSISNLIEKEVTRIMENVDLKKQLKLSDLEAVFWSLQTAIATNDDNPIERFRQHIISGEVSSHTDTYSRIMQDTADFLESDELKSLATHCINRGFSLLADQLSDFYSQNGIVEIPSTSAGDFHNPFDCKKPVAKLLPIINGLLSKQVLPTQFVQQLITNEKLQHFGANVYESLL